MFKNKTEFRTKLFKPFVVNIDPNIVTFLALVAAILAGYMFYSGFLALAIVFVFLNGFLDILDGEIAKTHKKETALGDFLDHFFDRLSDIAILLGIAMTYVPQFVGYSLIIITLLVSYLGTQAQALTKKRMYEGIIGRSDRLVIILFFSIMNLFYSDALFYGVLFLLVLSLITFAERFTKIVGELK